MPSGPEGSQDSTALALSGRHRTMPRMLEDYHVTTVCGGHKSIEELSIIFFAFHGQ